VSPPNITVYPAGQTVPSQTITSSLIQYPMSAFFDAAGNFYYSDYLTGVSEIQSGLSSPFSLGLKGFSHTYGIALDPTDGTLFASISSRAKQSLETVTYVSGRAEPRRYLNGGQVTGDYLTFGTLKNTEYLFETISGTNQVLVYKHNSRNPYTTLTTASSNTEGLAFKPAGVP